jgi:cholesterol oxidase
MKGFATAGATDPKDGYDRGKQANRPLRVKLTIALDDVDRFITDPRHEATVSGYVESPLVGGRQQIERGTFNLLVHETDPSKKRMLYRLFFTGADGQPRTLSGFKEIADDDGLDTWKDTTTLYTRLFAGIVDTQGESQASPETAGIIRIEQADFLRQLTTFRAEGPTLGDRLSAMSRFGTLFLGKLWDVYGRRVIDVGPF